MADTGNVPAVSIHPSSFTSELPDLSVLPLEEVVARFKDIEKKRGVNSQPEGEAELFWMVRHAPVELMSSVKIIAVRLGVSRAVLTKCMSRQIADWYANSLGMGELESAFNDIYSKIKLRSYTTLRIQAENPARFSYAQQPEYVKVSVSTIRWVMSKLGDLRDIVGVTQTDLLLASFCWSLTTIDNKEWDARNIDNAFKQEADNISILIRDRLIDVRALCAKYQVREGLRGSS